MASAWDVASVVGPVALGFVAMIVSGVVSASPEATAFFQRTTRRILSYLLPSRVQCRSLVWSDVRSGLIHRCHSSCSHINSQAVKVHDSTNCWEESIGKVFNHPWVSTIHHDSSDNNMVKKPLQLPLLQDYVQIDAQILKAFLILTVDTYRTSKIVDIESILEIKCYSGVITIHLRAPPMSPINTSLTKVEVERIVEGYPPFYRSTISTPGPNAVVLKHPITKAGHLSRGAWVLAVGLSTSNGRIPALYSMQQRRQNNDDVYWRGTRVMSAFEMINRTLTQLRDYEKLRRQGEQHSRMLGDHALTCYNLMMYPSWSPKPWVLKTQEIESQVLFAPLLGECLCTRTCLGKNPHSKTCGRGQHTKKDPAKKLSAKQCEAALEIFNNYNLLEDNLEIIYPVLLEVLQSIILGMCEVEHYFSKKGQNFDLPEILKDKRRIYLRTCATDSD